MQVGRNNNNRFRKLIPNNNAHINPTTAQIYSAHSKPYSGSHSKIETIYSNVHKANFHSLERQSGQELKSVRERQIVERRLRTISAAAFEGDKQNHNFNDNNLKRSSDKLIADQVQCGKKSKLNQLMDLIVQFKFKTDSILKYEEELIQNQNQTKQSPKVDEIVFEEEVYELIRKTRQSSVNLMGLYINRVIREIKKDVIKTMAEYEVQIQEEYINVQTKYEPENYLISNIVVQRNEKQDRINAKARGNLMNVNKFFEGK